MKKIDSSKLIDFPSVHLHREELDEILSIFGEISANVFIADDEYEYVSLDELKEKRGGMIRILKLSASDPYISLEFRTNGMFRGVSLYVARTDEKHIYALSQISEILNKKRSALTYVFSPAVGYYIPGIFFVFGESLAESIERFLDNKLSTYSFLALIVALPVVTYLVRTGKLLTLNLNRRHEEKNFLSRQKDDLIKIFFGAIVGGIVTYILAYLA